MYKIKPLSNSKITVPSNIGSKKIIKSALPSIHKQNLLLDTNIMLKNTDKQGNKFSSNYQKFCQIPQPIQLKLTQPLKQSLVQRKKLTRPWGAKLIDLNTSNLLTERLRGSSQKSKQLWHQRRSSIRQSFLKSKQLQYYTSEIRPNQECTETLRLVKVISNRQKSISRDKTTTCKIALKKSIFPLTQKQYQHKKLIEQFQKQQDLLSTINQNEGEQDQKFISIQSFTNLVF